MTGNPTQVDSADHNQANSSRSNQAWGSGVRSPAGIRTRGSTIPGSVPAEINPGRDPSRFAARDLSARLEALQRYREFLVAYREARTRWIAGDAFPFPMGTYWLRRFAAIPLAS
jgi:hypothetical protein